MGQARLCRVRQQYKEALDVLSEVMGLYSWFLPAHEERASVLMAMGEWDQAIETARGIISRDGGNIEALRVSALYFLSQKSLSSEATSKLDELAAALERQEPLNAPLYYNVCRPLARLCGRQPSILSVTVELSAKVSSPTAAPRTTLSCLLYVN